MFEDGLLSPEILEVAATLTRDLDGEAGARLDHFAEIRRLEQSGRRSDGQALDHPYLVVSYTPEGDISPESLQGHETELVQLAMHILGGSNQRWREGAYMCHNDKSELSFFESGRVILTTQAPFSTATGDEVPGLGIGVLENKLISVGAALDPGTFHVHLTLCGVEGARLLIDGFSDFRFSSMHVTIHAQVDLSERADKALRPLIRRVWQAVGLGDSRNYAEDGTWKAWNRYLRWAEE